MNENWIISTVLATVQPKLFSLTLEAQDLSRAIHFPIDSRFVLVSQIHSCQIPENTLRMYYVYFL